MNSEKLIPHLFRTEAGKIATVLSKHFGIEHIEIAEDITSDAFLAALETWPYNGLPENPVAWLYTVAKNKARNYFSRKQFYNDRVSTQLKYSVPDPADIEVDLSDKNIADSQLQMLFAICHPSIPAESQIGLALRILCGFGIEEIANAFLTSKETINKRLYRAKERLRNEHIKIVFPPENEINNRLDNVLKTLYLLFNEGYYSETSDQIIKHDLCLEAMRLTYLLIECDQTNQLHVNALLAMMCFHSSRFEARQNHLGEMILYSNQDQALWDRELISKGAYYLNQAAKGDRITKYHLEAAIAYWHTVKKDTKEKWENILYLYNRLLQIENSPITALNRVFSISKVHGNRKAVAEAEKLQLTDNQYYHTLLGVLHWDIDLTKSKTHFEKALKLAKSVIDKRTIQKYLELCAL